MKTNKEVFMSSRVSCGSQFCRRLLAVLVSGIFATTAWCASDTWTDLSTDTTWKFDYTGPKATITGATGYGSEVKVPEEVYVGTTPYTVSAIGDQTFDATVDAQATTITRIVIPSTVVTIGERAFYGCSGLEDVGLNDGLGMIKANAFQNAVNLPRIVMPKSVKVIEDGAFSGCGALETALFAGNANQIYRTTSMIEKMDAAAVFAGTPFYDGVNVNDKFDGAIGIGGTEGTSSACNICADTEGGEPTFPDTKTMWWAWTAPDGVDWAAFYTYGSSFDTKMGVYVGGGFPLTAIKENDDRAGAPYTSFVSFKVTPGVTYYICVGGYNGASGTINLAWKTTSEPFSLVVVDDAVIGFLGKCPESVTIPDSVTVIEDSAFSHDEDTSVEKLESVVIPESVVRIGNNAFYGCNNLSSVTFENVEVPIDVDLNSAFFGTKYFDSLNDNDNFAKAIELTGRRGSVMSNNEFAGIQDYPAPGEPFYTMSHEHTLWWKWTAPADVTRAVFHTYGSNFDTVLGVYTGTAVNNLSEVAYNANHNWWAEKSKTSCVRFDVSPGATYYICVGSEYLSATAGTVKLGWTSCGDGEYSLLTWGETLLGFVGTLPESVVIPDSVGIIEKKAFSYTKYEAADIKPLKHIVIPEGVTSIGESAFYSDNLTSVVIPENVEKIGDFAFGYCLGLSSVTFEGDALEIAMYPYTVFQDTPFLAEVNKNNDWGNAIELTGPKGSVTAWNAFATDEGGEPPDTKDHSLWWKWKAPAGVTKAVFHTYGSAFDTVLGVYTGDTVNNLNPVVINDDRGDMMSFVAFDVTPGDLYYICVAGSDEDEAGTVELTWETSNGFSLVVDDGTVIGFLGECPAKLTIPNTVTMIGESAFDYNLAPSAANLTSVEIPGIVTNIGWYAFCDCANLTSVTFNEGLQTIDLGAFSGCKGLAGQTIILPTTLEEIADEAFRDVGGKLTLDLPRSLKGALESGAVGTTVLTVRYYVKATLDPNEGVLADRVRMIYGDVYGDLSPLPTRTGYTFKGWKNGNTAITATTPLPDGATLTLTAQWEISKHTVALDLGGEIVVDDGTKVGDLPKPARDHYAFIGWSTADGTLLPDDTPVTSDLKLFAKWKAIYYVHSTVGEAVPPAASTYDGYLYKGEELAGTITVKVGKPSKAGLSSVKATVILANGSKVTLTTAGKGTAMSKDAPTTVTLTGGAACEVTLGSDGMKGTYGEYGIDGARNVFVSKDPQDRPVAGAALSAWYGAVNVAWSGASGWNALSVSIANKGKASVSGSLADGTKVTAKGQVIVGEEWCCVPVLVTRKANLAFLLWLPLDGSATPGTLGLGEDVKVGRPGLLKGEQPAFRVDSATFNTMWGKSALPYLPDGVTVKGGQQWGLPKAGKVTYVRGSTTVDAAKLQSNPAALKLKFKSKDGTFGGSFKAYVDVNGKLKATTVTVSGVLVNGAGYGTATIKRVGSVPVTIE